jgi:glycine/D-amino acid oxidase-like deaminating enzyme
MNLQTHTGVTAIVDGPKGPIVKTTRGDISASLVIAASNAYTASFLPEFASKIVPVRGTVSATRPPVSHRPGGHPGPLRYTYGYRHGVGDTDYLIPRQGHVAKGKGDTSIILGGAKSRLLKNHELWYDNINDNEEMPGARQCFEEFMPKTFVGWDGGADNIEKVWTGVLGYSNDFSPFVGLHPERKGIMVCAGFTGHGAWTHNPTFMAYADRQKGMPQIPACTYALAGLAVSFLRDGGKVSPNSKATFDSTQPHTFRLTKERYESTVNVIIEYMGQSGDASGAMDTTDEAAMLARSKL